MAGLQSDSRKSLCSRIPFKIWRPDLPRRSEDSGDEGARTDVSRRMPQACHEVRHSNSLG
jgi:hypothetical protein